MISSPSELTIASLAKYHEKNALGETRICHVFENGEADGLREVASLVQSGSLTVNVETPIFSNPFHYASHITDPATLEIIFSMATFELITSKNQLDESPLSLAIAQDNAEFFTKILKVFPQIIEMEDTEQGSMMRYPSLLHDIARLNAQRCFNVLKAKCSEYQWMDMCSVRIGEKLPCEVALMTENHEMYQLFAGYRRDNLPTATWLFALKIAQEKTDVEVPWHLQCILHDAKDEVEHQLAQAEWDEQEDIDIYDAEQKLRLLRLR